MIRLNILALIVAIQLLGISCSQKKDRTSLDFTSDTPTDFKMLCFPTDKGWGYSISYKDKEYIRQLYLPAVEGCVPIETKEQATKLATVVISKMRKRENPSLTPKDLEVLGFETLSNNRCDSFFNSQKIH